jgi:DNA-binding transcriptional MerR regulator
MVDIAADDGLAIAEMAEVTGVSGHTLRYWERAGLIEGIARNAGQHRRYFAADVEWVEFLMRLHETGMSIADMRRFAQLRAEGPSTVQARSQLLKTHRLGLRRRITTLQAHEQALNDKIVTYEQMPAGNPSNDRIADE